MVNRVSLVVDSTCDVPREFVAKHGIEVVPAFVNFGAESFPDDGVALPPTEFYRRMSVEKELPRTSAMPTGLAQEAMRRQLEKSEAVLVISLSPEFSGIYNTFKLAAQQVDPARITLFDSGSVSMGYGLQVVAAAEAVARGASLEEVIAAVQSAKDRLRFYAVIDTLDNLRRSGRISYVVAGLGALLQIKPILNIKDGKADTAQRVRTHSKALQTLVEMVQAGGKLERMAIVHTNALSAAQDLRARLEAFAPAEVFIVEATPAIGVHVGPGCLAVAYISAQ